MNTTPRQPVCIFSSRVIVMMLASLVISGISGCGDGRSSGGARAQYQDAGLQMRLPAGWSLDRSGIHSQRGHRDDHHGLVYLDSLQTDSLDAHVSRIIDAEGLNVVSREMMDVDGHQAIELITEATYHVYEVYILRGDEIVVVSFRTLPAAFEAQLGAFRDATRSIRFQ